MGAKARVNWRNCQNKWKLYLANYTVKFWARAAWNLTAKKSCAGRSIMVIYCGHFLWHLLHHDFVIWQVFSCAALFCPFFYYYFDYKNIFIAYERYGNLSAVFGLLKMPIAEALLVVVPTNDIHVPRKRLSKSLHRGTLGQWILIGHDLLVSPVRFCYIAREFFARQWRLCGGNIEAVATTKGVFVPF